MKKILLETAELCYSDEGILYIRLLENAEIDLTRSKEMQRASVEITKGDKFVALIDARAKVTVTKEAREWGSTKEAHGKMIAQAIWVNSLANRLVGNFIIQFHKPYAPTKLFSDENTALEWLRGQKSMNDGNSSR